MPDVNYIKKIFSHLSSKLRTYSFFWRWFCSEIFLHWSAKKVFLWYGKWKSLTIKLCRTFNNKIQLKKKLGGGGSVIIKMCARLLPALHKINTWVYSIELIQPGSGTLSFIDWSCSGNLSKNQCFQFQQYNGKHPRISPFLFVIRTNWHNTWNCYFANIYIYIHVFVKFKVMCLFMIMYIKGVIMM